MPLEVIPGYVPPWRVSAMRGHAKPFAARKYLAVFHGHSALTDRRPAGSASPAKASRRAKGGLPSHPAPSDPHICEMKQYELSKPPRMPRVYHPRTLK